MSLPRAGIASGRDLPVLHAHHPRALLPGKRGGGVTGSIIYNNDFMRLAKRFRPIPNGGNTSANPCFLVVRWNNERDHVFNSCKILEKPIVGRKNSQTTQTEN